MKIVVVAILCLGMVSPGWGASASPCDLRTDERASLYHAEWEKILKAGDFPKLESSMEKTYEITLKEGNGDHLFNVRPFLNLMISDNKLLLQWKNEMPNAFFSNYVMGENSLREAEYLRGGQAASALSATEWKDIRILHQNARDAFAVAKLAKPERAIIEAALITIDASDNGPDAVSEDLKRANASDPKNISARLTAINYLAPRWGGSFEAVDDVVIQAKAAKLPETHIVYLTMAAENVKGSHFEIIERNKLKAREHYKKAYAICNKSDFAIGGLSRTIGD